MSLSLTQEVETIVKASVMTPDIGGHIHMVVGITQEGPENPVRTLTQECAVSVGGGGECSVSVLFSQSLKLSDLCSVVLVFFLS